jgi:hypothetical protein
MFDGYGLIFYLESIILHAGDSQKSPLKTGIAIMNAKLMVQVPILENGAERRIRGIFFFAYPLVVGVGLRSK